MVHSVATWAFFDFRRLACVQRHAAISAQRLKRVPAQLHPAEQGGENPTSTTTSYIQNPRIPGALP